MRQVILSNHHKQSVDLYFPPLKRYDQQNNLSNIDQPMITYRELKKLYQEAQEYDFLVGKTPEVLPDYLGQDD